MSDEVSKDLEAPEAGLVGLTRESVGARLRAAREMRNLQASEVALQLRVGQRQLDALEADQWHALPGSTFIRGLIRNYARFLGVDHAPLLKLVDEVIQPEQKRLSLPECDAGPMPVGAKAREKRLFWAGALILLIAVAALLIPPDFLAFKSIVSSRKTDNKNSVPVDSIQGDSAPVAGAPKAMESPVTSTLPPVSVSSSAASSVAASVPVVLLKLQFAQPSWVEIRDGSGTLVVSQTHSAGTSIDVPGQPPFALTLGNASGVQIRFRDQPVDTSPFRRGEVARLTLQ